MIIYFTIIFNVYGQSRRYQPSSEIENSWYTHIDKTVWPYDVKNELMNYQETLIGWVGIIEKFNIVITDNNEFNIIQYYIKHHYYDWIEDFGIENKPIRLSPDGEGYIVCDFYIKKSHDPEEITKDITGDCLIIYGYPIKIFAEDDVIVIQAKYMRTIQKQYVNPSWLRYGRKGFDIFN